MVIESPRERAMTPEYYVSAGKRNVKLNQRGLSADRPAHAYGPFSANDGRNRLVTVFATDDDSCDAILAHWRERIRK